MDKLWWMPVSPATSMALLFLLLLMRGVALAVAPRIIIDIAQDLLGAGTLGKRTTSITVTTCKQKRCPEEKLRMSSTTG